MKIMMSTLVSFIFSVLQENTEALKTKMSELRLYCDLLLQQVNKIQESPQAETAADFRGGKGVLVLSQPSLHLLYLSRTRVYIYMTIKQYISWASINTKCLFVHACTNELYYHSDFIVVAFITKMRGKSQS